MNAQVLPEYDDLVPDKNYIWVDGYALENGKTRKGFYREHTAKGYSWVEAHFSNEGHWVENHWQPISSRTGYTWVAGYAGPDQYWVMGHWRITSRENYVWIAPTFAAGSWVHGYWNPLSLRTGYIWVPGHRHIIKGGWIQGHWRPSARAGFKWMQGFWRYGIWVPGYWNPVKSRMDHMWVAGYWGLNNWVAGFWRTNSRVGFHWTAGHWGPRGWIVGGWFKGPRKKIARKFPRVRHVHHMH